MTAPRRRLIVKELREQFHVSQRRASRALDLARSSLRYAPSFAMNRRRWLDGSRNWPGAPAVRLPADLGPLGSRGLVGQQEGGSSHLASVGAEAGQAAGRPQAPPTAWAGSERLSSPAVAWEGRRMDMGLYLRSYQRRP